MKLLIQSAMIFFGTLMTAALVALGEPASTGPAVERSPDATQPSGHVMASTPAAAEAGVAPTLTAFAAPRGGQPSSGAAQRRAMTAPGR